jgi:hypothetical protein
MDARMAALLAGDTKARNAAVAKIMIRVAPSLRSGQKSHADLHILLNACLELAPLASSPHEEAQMAARQIGTALAAGAFGWTEPDRPTTARSWEALRADPMRWRQEIITRMVQAPHVLPKVLMADLLTALAELNSGAEVAPDLLRPTEKARWGRGRNPREADECEEMLLCWMAWECGRGRKAGDVTREIASAVHKTAKTVEAWRADWIRRAGRDEVARCLNDYRSRGEEGRPFAEVSFAIKDIARLWLSARAPEKTLSRRWLPK